MRKDNTSVGSIGANGGRPFVAGPSKGIKFGNSSADPCTNSGGTADNSYDLGGSSIRWKDLYLGGGIYVGGTASANFFDDQEEGTWTPAIIGATTAGSSPTGVGSYTKVGRLVTATATFGNVTVSGAAGYTYISGLPFSASNGTSGAAHGAVGTSNYGTDIYIGSVLNGETVIRIRTANTTVYKTISNAASIYLLCTVSYETST